MRGKSLSTDIKYMIIIMRRDHRKSIKEIASALSAQTGKDITTSAVAKILQRELGTDVWRAIKAADQAEAKAKAIALMQSGTPTREIAKKLNLTRVRVNLLLRGEPRPHRQASSARVKDPALDQRDAQIIAWHEDGESHEWIGNAAGIKARQVSRVIRKHGIVLSRGKSKARAMALAERNAAICGWYSGGAPMQWICDQTNLSRSLINRVLRDGGLIKGKGFNRD